MPQKLTLLHRGLLLRDREGLVDPLRNAGFHSIHEGRVKVHGDDDCGVAQSFFHDLRMHNGLDKSQRVSVTELVDLNAGRRLCDTPGA